ncbi:hypothetical protein QLS71_016875 [Mariniflexile litorale]|uniref:XRE family transcriptional regulator n=1 Tax=Mariniflexile litorale TaxID=3045158 RepID=A0AAU7EEI3_9FLAO|nr:hypothetical protein [Mariniflexile sp. KMM 9835]MDQ8211518.1 hypothetical protein [Mariniflexile sp. KMM 9835]
MYRQCIYPKEISIILGKSYTFSCKLVRTIKDAQGITSQRTITIKEFCDYMDMPYEDVFTMINGRSV